jgi:ribosomal-protein-alanine N-acetyltransferase
MILEKDELLENYSVVFLARVVYELANDSFTNGSPWTESQFLNDLKQDFSTYYFYVVEDEILGFVSFHYVLDEAEIENICVKKGMTHQGIGSNLFTHVFSELQKLSVHSLFLEVRESNTVAREMYEKSGFEEISTRKNYYHAPVEDAIIMKKVLGN